jgi:hypothetical protein
MHAKRGIWAKACVVHDARAKSQAFRMRSRRDTAAVVRIQGPRKRRGWGWGDAAKS